MKYIIKGLLSTILAAGLMVTTPAISSAFAGGAEGDYQRDKTCGEMRRAGTVEWYSIASGTVNTGGGRNGYSGFVTKACHTTEASRLQ